MNRHPLDDFFARGLNDHSLPPQRANWAEMQKRMHRTQTRKPVWGWYAVAASVAVVLMAGWLYWRSENTVQPADKLIAQSAEPDRLKTNEPLGKPMAEIAVPTPAPGVIPVGGAAVKRQEAMDEPSVPEKIDEVIIAEAQPQPEASMLSAPMPDVPPQLMTSEKTAATPVERKLVVQFEPVIVAQQVESEPALIEETGETTAKKRVRLGRLLRQMRKGEQIDWQEAGLAPDNLLAKASRTVRQGKEKVLDSYENLREQATDKFENNN